MAKNTEQSQVYRRDAETLRKTKEKGESADWGCMPTGRGFESAETAESAENTKKTIRATDRCGGRG